MKNLIRIKAIIQINYKNKLKHNPYQKMSEEKYLQFDVNTTLFVGGLSITATEEDLVSYFSQFGDKVQVKIKKKKATDSINLGYAYLVTSSSTKQKILRQKFHMIAGRQVECSQYHPKGRQRNKHLLDQQQRKIFVRGLSGKRSMAFIEKFFSRFGQLENCYHRQDENGQILKTEVFLMFKSAKSTFEVEKLASNRDLWLDGSCLEVIRPKINIPDSSTRDKQRRSSQNSEKSKQSKLERQYQIQIPVSESWNSNEIRRQTPIPSSLDKILSSQKPFQSNSILDENFLRKSRILHSDPQSSHNSMLYTQIPPQQTQDSSKFAYFNKRESGVVRKDSSLSSPHFSNEEGFYDDFNMEMFRFYKSFYLKEQQRRKLKQWNIRPSSINYNFDQASGNSWSQENLKFNECNQDKIF